MLESDDPPQDLNFKPNQIKFGEGRISYIEGVETADIYIGAFSGERNIDALCFDVSHDFLKLTYNLRMFFEFVFPLYKLDFSRFLRCRN